MLTADLVRASIRRGVVVPHWVDPEDPELLSLAEALAGMFASCRGRARRELHEELEELLGTGTGYVLHRGLTKLLLDRCEFATESPCEPSELRHEVFERAATVYRDPGAAFDRRSVLEETANARGIDPAELERSLWADLRDEQVLSSFQAIRPEALLRRYNTALAQAVLLRATRLEVRVGNQTAPRYRELFRAIKFHRLLHTVEGTARDGFRISLDGPLSLFRASTRYGVQMAAFLPTLLALDSWSLEAEVRWGKQRVSRAFRLDSRSGLDPGRHLRGQWQPPELAWFTERFAALESDWRIEDGTELIDLGGRGVLVPDHVFVHRPTGLRVYFEIFGYWRRGALASRLELLARHGPPHLILGVARQLHAGREAVDEVPASVYVFREYPIAREVLERLETIAAARNRALRPSPPPKD